MQVQKFTVQYAKLFILLALATEDEPFCSYTPYLLCKAPSQATEKAISTASWLFQMDQVQHLGGMGDFPSLRAADDVQLQSCGEKAAYPLPPAPHIAQRAKTRKVCLEHAVSQDNTKNCLSKSKIGQRQGFVCKDTRVEFTNSYFYSAALNTSEFLYLQHLYYVFIRPSIRDSEPV